MDKTNQRRQTRNRPTEPISLRMPPHRIQIVRDIQKDRGDECLSDTLTVAVNEFIDRHLKPAA